MKNNKTFDFFDLVLGMLVFLPGILWVMTSSWHLFLDCISFVFPVIVFIMAYKVAVIKKDDK